MKHWQIFITLIVLLSTNSEAQEYWLQKVPDKIGSWSDWTLISNDLFFEIPVSRIDTAEAWLRNQEFMALENGSFEYFGQPKFKCFYGAKPYLVRALFQNGGTGSFSLYWADSALIVAHGSLGQASVIRNSALVACLSKQPKTIYSTISGDL